VHLHNRIEVLRPLGGIEGLRFAVHANLQPHAKVAPSTWSPRPKMAWPALARDQPHAGAG
jgi:hypothetical protein